MSPRHRGKIPIEIERRVVKLIEQGIHASEIYRRVGVSQSTVRAVAKRHELKIVIGDKKAPIKKQVYVQTYSSAQDEFRRRAASLRW